ncbi:5,10-methylenetetrahydrofolate reductase [Paenibacillus hemerocallicola]|uniref:Methylenetetrahydrofolate reductase n=1 Tax=Paenibacillus hemerocallicola TaxID=1172614 RepID=A0A5C4T428_9BACL|nr:methylenetetrahydrofolate reductase [Paenibacillus hemerocallicola]TNJ63834.1 5,10-methylenetetrahydrofolate reductase [Paenibacillus hemerocallicola]
MLKQKISNKQPGILTYGITPPKLNTVSEKVAEISQKQIERVRGLGLDGLIVYDVQEEADRVEEERPFPYLQTIDPNDYCKTYLHQLDLPKIIYRCVGKNTEAQFSEWVGSDTEEDRFSVFVGASSSKQKVQMGLTDAYRLARSLNGNLTMGGVVIPERHIAKKDEHLRTVTKANNGCKFFVSQATYNVDASKNFLSDYYYHCRHHQIEMVPILFNLAPCGSQKTLQFMKWLGISIPRWLENELIHSNDILDKSLALSRDIFAELFDFGMEKGIPIGCSVESVSTRKVEIEASIQLVNEIKTILGKSVVHSQ